MSACFISQPKLPVHRFAHFWTSTKLRANLRISKNVLLKFDITCQGFVINKFLNSANTLGALPLPYEHFLMILKIRLFNALQKPRRTTKKAKKRRKKKLKMTRSGASANLEIIFDNKEEALLFEPNPNKSQQVISQFLSFRFHSYKFNN